jgi:HSP20 family protein
MPKINLLPWRKEENKVPVKQAEDNPMLTLQQDMNRLFDNFFDRGFGMRPFGGDEMWDQFQPRIDVVDGEKSIEVTAELPGLDEDEIELTLSQNTLQISGEKKAESEDKGKNYYRMERSYGAFRRVIEMPSAVDADKVKATFKKGVLTVVLPKIIEEEGRKRITIKK